MHSEDGFAGMVDSTGTPLTKMPDFVRSGTNGFLLNDNGEALMQRRSDNGYWGLPGCGVDVGESVEQGAVREVLEETGLNVTTNRLIGIYLDPKHFTIMSYPQGRVIQYVIMLFECAYVSDELALSDESTEIGYFPPDALPENTLLSHRIRIQDALAGQAPSLAGQAPLHSQRTGRFVNRPYGWRGTDGMKRGGGYGRGAGLGGGR